MSNVGRIDVSLTGDVSQLNDAMKRSADQVESSVAAIRQSLASLKFQLDTLNSQSRTASEGIETIRASAKKSEESVSSLSRVETGIRRVVESAAGLGAAKLAMEAFFASTAKGAIASTSSLGSMAEAMTNVYRAARLALSPTLFTAGTLAAGYALEKTGEAAYGAAGTLRSQATIAGLNKTPISAQQVSDLSLAGGGQNLTSYLGLYNASGGQNLRNIAEQLSAIKDPADKARAALSIFGADASTALKLLNESFVENSDRVKDWSLSYSAETREELYQFRDDIDSLREPFSSLSDTVESAGTKIKATLVGLFAAGYGKLRDGSLVGDILAPFNLDRWLPKGSGGVGSAISGAFATEGASFRNGGLGSFFGTADEQFSTEFQRNLTQNKSFQQNLTAGAKGLPQAVIPDSLTDLSQFNNQAGPAALRDKLDGLKQSRQRIISQYFTRDAEGNLQFKDDTSAIEQANAVTSLGTTDKSIADLQSKLDALKKSPAPIKSEDFYGNARKELTAQIAGAESEATAAGRDPLTRAIAKGAAEATEQIVRLNSEYAKFKAEQLQRATDDKSPSELAAANALQGGLTSTQSLGILADQTQLSMAREVAEVKNRAAEQQKELANQAFEVETENINAMIEQISGIGKITEGEKEHLRVLEQISKINGQTRIVAYQLDAAGKGRDAQRQSELLAISAEAYANRLPGESDEDVQATIDAQTAQRKAQFQLEDAVSGRSDGAAKGMRRFFQEFEDNTESAGNDVRTILGGAFNGLDQQLTDLITGQKTNWSGFFRGIAADIAKIGLQSSFSGMFKALGLGSGASGGILAALGLGGTGAGGVLGTAVGATSASTGGGIWGTVDKATGGILSQFANGLFGHLANGYGLSTADQDNLGNFSNSELSQLRTPNGGYSSLADFDNSSQAFSFGNLSGAGSGSPDGSELSPLYVQLAGDTMGGGGSSVGSLLSSLSGSAGGIINSLVNFLPHFAGGGDPTGPSVVGENGTELFVPHTAGTIVPNGRFGGGQTVNYNIDARGSDNSAETERRVRQGLRQAHQQGAADGARLSREARSRVPRSKAYAT